MITKLTFHLNNWCLIIFLRVIHYCINPGNILAYISNYLHLLSTVNLRPATLMWWEISPAMFSTTSPIPQRFTAISFIFFLLRLRTMSSLSCIEILMRSHIFLFTYILRSSSLLRPFSFSIIITFPILLELRLGLWILIIVLQLSDGFLQWSSLIKLNLVFECYWKPTNKPLNLHFLILEIRHISQQLYKYGVYSSSVMEPILSSYKSLAFPS